MGCWEVETKIIFQPERLFPSLYKQGRDNFVEINHCVVSGYETHKTAHQGRWTACFAGDSHLPARRGAKPISSNQQHEGVGKHWEREERSGNVKKRS